MKVVYTNRHIHLNLPLQQIHPIQFTELLKPPVGAYPPRAPDILVVLGTAKVMKTLREKVMRTGVTKQRRKRRMKKYLMKCFCTKHFSSKPSLEINII